MTFFAGVRRDGVDIWDYQSKQPLVTLKPQPPNEEMFYSRLLCCTNDGGKIAVAAGDCCVIVVWDISDIGSCQMLYMIRQLGPEFISSFCFTKSGEYLVASVGCRAVLYDARNGSLVRIIDSTAYYRTAYVHTVGDRILTVSAEGTVKLWDDGFEVSRQQQLEKVILSCSVNADEKLAVFAGADGMFILLDLVTFEATAASGRGAGNLFNIQFNAAAITYTHL
jgi:hypothetical protein